ncbi:TolB-like protein/class 3 adenylate cyclase [Rhizobium sp. BK650]|uniref:adenylate/guanylate cyclase domain-containing protein n=1 Tax=Rhizobium sp. BK650 TaxID=2586990 RepID=UPI00161D917C|nr:adenylate/guanylate cyclase domain-containing protein [Rhizobium sp. BK650]MBB3655037.1 TolB-like protein/class 3 adenylate cyclase [Rhizobium sp. BK650]
MDRKLAAIMSADVVGYSRLTALDEEGTIRALDRSRERIDRLVAQYAGRIFGLAGDGIMAEFSSAVQAVRCAIQIQREFSADEGDGDSSLKLRIGINLGDVIIAGDDLLGDGVNVAARLQSIAGSSAICISGPVRDQLGAKAEFRVRNMGKRVLKNIPTAIPVFQVDWSAGPGVSRVTGSPSTAPSGDSSGPPVIAILPFANLAGDEFWERLAVGLAADIIADLARYPNLAVISRQTMMAYKGCENDVVSIGRQLKADYVLEGNLQASGDQVRISVQLTDASNGASLWTARYHETVDNLFELQDAVTASVVNALGNCSGKLLKFRRDVLRRQKPASLQAYDCYLLGEEQLDLFTRASIAESIRFLSRAVQLDPKLARAWTGLGCAYSAGVCNGFSEDPASAVRLFEDCVEKALELDPQDLTARLGAAGFRALRGDLEGALDDHEMVLTSAPHDADTIAMLAGNMALVAGEPKHGCELARRAIRLNPSIPWYYGMLGRCCFVAGLYKECIAALNKAPPQSPATLLFTAMAAAMLNREGDAARFVARLDEPFPGFSAEAFIRGYPVTNPVALAAIRNGAERLRSRAAGES